MRTAMIAMTTSNSTSVKPRRRRECSLGTGVPPGDGDMMERISSSGLTVAPETGRVQHSGGQPQQISRLSRPERLVKQLKDVVANSWQAFHARRGSRRHSLVPKQEFGNEGTWGTRGTARAKWGYRE